LVIACLAGCGDRPVAAAKKSSSHPTSVRPIEQGVKLPAVTQSEYASLEAAWADVEALSGDPAGGQKLLRIERWLDLQGDEVVAEFIAKIKDPSAGLATRLTACRALARRGPVGTQTLLEATDGQPRQLRLKAIESLSRIDPPSDEIVEKLVGLLDDEDFEIRKAALVGLREVGPPAQRASGKLQSLFNDPQEDETIRSLAKAALRAVDPRTGLMKSE
jgi:HEAT repeat protein